MAEQLVQQYGLMGFFLASILAATLVPLSTEVVAVLMYVQGFSPVGIVISGTVGGYIGSLVNYWMALYGGKLAFGRLFKVEPERIERFGRAYRKWGTPLLLFSWLPVLGESITLVGGVLRIALLPFSFWVLAGRAIRFVLLLWLTGEIL